MQTHRMYLEHHLRPTNNSVNENLAERLVRIRKTIFDLQRKLTTEKELLEREKMMTASMFLLPTTNEYYTLVYSRSEGEKSQLHQRDGLIPEHTFNDGEAMYRYEAPAENLLDNVSLTRSEKIFLECERKMAARSRIQQYKKHLTAVENKCNLELGAMKDSICNLKRVSTELKLEAGNNQQNVDKGFFYEDVY